MAIREIRESIQQTGTATGKVLQFQKRINLEHGKRHNILQIDFFDDGLIGATNTGSNFAYQVYVTNYPVVLTQNEFHAGGMPSGPMAGDEQVLFKANQLSFNSPATQAAFLRQEFPNQFLSAFPTFSFYTPTLYFTIIITDPSATAYTKTVNMSLYMAVQTQDCDAVEYGMGMIDEFSVNNAMVLRNQGIMIDQSQIKDALPMWSIGGQRNQIMSANDINTHGQQWFYSQAGYGEGETMSSSTLVRSGLSLARTMVGAESAFGDRTAEIPDWFKAIAKPFAGIEGGAIRAQAPPLKFSDNGNTLMF
jgi:hypothetical protein